jgi:hypothetical protein
MAKQQGKIVNILGQKVPERELKAALRDVLMTRGLSGDLILERKPTKKEQLMTKKDENFVPPVFYKYAFF